MVSLDSATSSVVIFGNPSPILSVLDCSSNQVLSLDTKYYTVRVQVVTSPNFAPLPNPVLPVNAVIMNGSLEEATVIGETESFKQSDVRLFLPGPDPTKDMFDWAIENQVEIVDIEDEPERVREALESSVWPGAEMKNQSANHLLAPSPPPPEPDNINAPDGANGNDEFNDFVGFDDNFSDLIIDDEVDLAEMAGLFSMVNRVREEGSHMTDQDRRQNAERVISAISKMLGDDLDL